ncbi:hypothetical protein FQN49_003654 [Arthroderma sp. PD_2]|nr:hypothetical protein FQN49_003654 [Arthroderma sp. PD_2]
MEQPIYEIGVFTSSSKNNDTELTAHVSDKQIKVKVFATDFDGYPALLERYLLYLKRLEPDYIPTDKELDEDGGFVDPLEELHDWILEPFLPIFRDLRPLDRGKQYTLDEYIFAEQLHYTIRVTEGEIVPVFVKRTNGRGHKYIGARLPSSSLVGYPMPAIYRPDDIHIPMDDDATSIPTPPRKVFIHGRSKPSFLKMVYHGDVKTTHRELLTYIKIHAAQFDATVWTSRLHGIVQREEGHIMGLILSYIDTDGATLDCAKHDPQYVKHRQKWFDQVSQTLKQFHSHGIIWGDAKAANVLIDNENNAYLVDFGGSYTKGWVDKDKAGTVEGDLQGLESIRNHLFD